MHLIVDIGNTTIAFAVIDRDKVLTDKKIETVVKKDSLRLQLTGLLRGFKRRYGRLQQAIICSVVPAAVSIVKSEIKSELGIKAFVIGEDIKVPMPNRYKNPRQVGQDRLVGAYAAMIFYGRPLIIIDLGTAITFDVVSVKGEYLGGAIVPGIRLSAEALFLKTALLPEINIQAPRSAIGKSTQESILSGLFYGYGCLCRGFVELMAKQVGGRPYVVMTGGHTQLMKKFIKGVNGLGNKENFDFKDMTRQNMKLGAIKKSPLRFIIDEHLVFKGMNLLLNR